MDNLSQRTILLVEDEPLIAVVEKRTLERHGYTVVTVDTGEKAIEYLHNGNDIDLILMDIDLGAGMDGTEAAETILREHEIPLAFLTSHTDPETVEKTEGITSYGYILKNSGDTVLLASIRMAFRLYETKREAVRQNMLMAAANEQLRLSSEQLEWWPNIMEYVLRHDISAVAVLDRDLHFVYVSERFLKDYAVSYSSVIGMHHYEVFPDIPQRWRDVHQRALSGETVYSDSDTFQRADGTVDYTRWECRPWYAPDGTVGGIILYTEVLTPFMQAERKRLEAEERIRFALEASDAGAWDLNLSDYSLTRSPLCDRIFGNDNPPPEWGYERFIEFVYPDDREQVNNHLQQAVEESRSVGFECRIVRADGALRWVWVAGRSSLTAAGEVSRISGIIQDITEPKRAEEELRLYAAEKVTLLKEVQHRVKNTMMTMGSLLSLQAATLQAPEAVAAINDARSRFHSMEVLYDQLYRTDGTAEGSVREYVESLVHTVIDLFPGGEAVRVTTEIDEFNLGMRQLSTVGMILNELVTNAMKYAFRGRDDGHFSVRVHRQGELVRAVVQDNGPGLSQEFNEEAGGGFGIDMVKALTEQLGGTLRLENNGGMRAVLDFKPGLGGSG